MQALTDSEFKATMREPMIDVTSAPGEAIDIWPYVAAIAPEVSLPAHVLKEELVEHVARSGDGVHDHVALPTGKENRYLVIVVDRIRRKVRGHHVLDLNREYGLA